MAADESGGSGGALLNLGIEVDNESEEEMETDVLSESKESETTVEDDDVEEGELSDSKNMESPQLGSSLVVDKTKRYENKEGGFIAGVDICGEEEKTKLGERAKRFGLDPSTIKPLTELELKKLYESLGMTSEEGTEKTFRLQALHMRGTEDMSTKDVFTYFKAFGPASVEWINDYTCNVVWLEELSAARALIGLSRRIKGLEKLKTSDSAFKDGEGTKDCKEVVIVTEEESDSEGDTEMIDESKTKQQDEKLAGAKPVAAELVGDGDDNNDDDVVDALSITIPIPPGKWRAGVTHPKAKNILLRFATRTDKKHPKAEKLSEYYKKYGNPNYGGIPGILTESRKRRYRRNEQQMPNKYNDNNFNKDENEFGIAKNPWGTLAESWSSSGNQEHYDRYSPPTKISRPLQSQVTVSSGLRGINMQTRIGTVAAPRSGSDNGSTSTDDDEEMSARTKVPRMRMYADEEEVKIEKRKAQRKKQSYDDEEQRSKHRSDLRHRLGRESQGHSETHHNRSRERDRDQEHSRGREHNRERVLPKLSSTVWSRLHHGRSKDESAHDETPHNAERKRKNRPTPEKQILSDDSDELFEKPVQLAFGDLRSKLNSMKTVGVRQKSPLRIEIDNDEYYRVIGSGSDE